MIRFVYSTEDTDLPRQEPYVNDICRIATDSGALSLRLAAVIDDNMEEIEL